MTSLIHSVRTAVGHTTEGLRIVLVSAIALFALAAVTASFGLLLHSQDGRIDELERRLSTSSSAREELIVERQRLAAGLTAARQRAAAAAERRFREGRREGLRSGYAAAFAGFPWQNGSWYAVRIVGGRNDRHEIGAQASLAPCELVFVRSNDVFSQGSGSAESCP